MTALVPSELQVLRLRAMGLTNAEVAYERGISVQTVKNHQTNAYRRLGADSLVAALWALGWIVLPDRVEACGLVAACNRPAGHRGHHGGFRAVAS